MRPIFSMRIFWNEHDQRLWLPWRLLLHGATVAAFGIGAAFPLAEGLTALHRRGLFLPALSKEPYDLVINMLVGPLLTAGIVLATVLCTRRLDRRDPREIGLAVGGRWLGDWLFGAALGGALMAGIFVAERALGWTQLNPHTRLAHPEIPLGLCLGFSVTKALCVGVYEEAVSRGYHLRNLAEAMYRRDRTVRAAVLAGTVLSSVLFALLHSISSQLSPLRVTGLVFNGFLLASGYVLTGSLGLCIGLHSGWNFFQGAVFGFPVSGDLEPGSLVDLGQGGPAWVTGGSYGPEGGLIGMLAALIGIVVVAIWAHARGGSTWLRATGWPWRRDSVYTARRSDEVIP
jgi:hypothetical protein